MATKPRIVTSVVNKHAHSFKPGDTQTSKNHGHRHEISYDSKGKPAIGRAAGHGHNV